MPLVENQTNQQQQQQQVEASAVRNIIMAFRGPMTEAHRERLNQTREALLEDLQPQDVMDYLVPVDVITIEVMRTIQQEIDRRRQVALLLDILVQPNQDDRVFELFRQALRETNQKRLADMFGQ